MFRLSVQADRIFIITHFRNNLFYFPLNLQRLTRYRGLKHSNLRKNPAFQLDVKVWDSAPAGFEDYSKIAYFLVASCREGVHQRTMFEYKNIVVYILLSSLFIKYNHRRLLRGRAVFRKCSAARGISLNVPSQLQVMFII